MCICMQGKCQEQAFLDAVFTGKMIHEREKKRERGGGGREEGREDRKANLLSEDEELQVCLKA